MKGSGPTLIDSRAIRGKSSLQGATTGRANHCLNLSRPPGLVEPMLQRTVEAENHKPAFTGNRLHQLFSKPAGALGPKCRSTESSALSFRSLLWLLTLGNCWSLCSIPRV